MLLIKKEDILLFYNSLRGISRSAKVKKNIIGSFVVKGVSIIISLVLVPMTIGYVSSELYGIWLSLATIIAWAGLFDLGFANGLRNKVAECVALNDWGKARRYISTAYLYFTAIFSVLSLLVFFLCPMINWTKVLNVDESYQELLITVMRIVIIFFSISMVVNIQKTILQALQLNALANAFDALGQILVLVIVFILTQTTRPSLIYLAYALSASPIVVSLITSIWLYGYKFKKLCPSITLIDTSLVKDILSLGIKFFVLQIAVIVIYQTMNIIIANTSGPNAVTEYNVVYKYISVPMMVSTIIVAPFWSAFTDAYTVNDLDWMRRSYKKLLQMFQFALLLLFLLVILSPLFFRLWLGDKVEIHFTMTISVTLYVTIMIWNGIHSSIINGIGLLKVQIITCLTSTIVNIPLALFAGRLLGASGVVATVALLSLPGAVLLYLQIKKIINGSAKGIWIK